MTLAATFAGLASSVPIELGREAARTAARVELAKPVYAQDRPGIAQRVGRWLLDLLQDLLERAGDAAPGGYLGLVALVVVAVAAVVAVRLGVGPLSRAGGGSASLFVGAQRRAADHRREAEGHAAAGRWAEALGERLRAVVRSLEERGLLDPRPGRTADEAAAEAGQVLPSCATDLIQAAHAFDEVWYGGRAGTEASYRQVAALDDAVTRARPTRAAAGATR